MNMNIFFRIYLLYLSCKGTFANRNSNGVNPLCTVSGEYFVQLGDDIDGDNSNDLFGTSVSLSSDGSVLAVGATDNDANGSNSGHVKVFEYVSNSWVQRGGDINGEASDDKSGISVDLSSDGSIVAIGAYKNDENGSDSGHVRVFQYSSSTWSQIGNDINGENSSDESGVSVSLSADGLTVAIGASQNDGNGSESGHVRVYRYNGSSWNLLGTDIDGKASDDRFGISVSLSDDGTTVAIGANKNDDNGSSSGHVQIYNYNGIDWDQVGTDVNGDTERDEFGISVDLSSDGSIVAIGAHANDGNGDRSGHVKVYQNNNGVWSQLGTDIDGENTFDESGYSVKLSSDGLTVVIGAYLNDGSGTDSGHVRFFKYDGSDWIQYGNDIDGETALDWSGSAISLTSDGETVAIGAYGNDGNGIESGHVRVVTMCELPSSSPSSNPTKSILPSSSPSQFPSKDPSVSPTNYPTKDPSASPSNYPTKDPTNYPSKDPSASPTNYPTKDPTASPTNYPTKDPTKYPTKDPTASPTNYPTKDPTKYPTKDPTASPTDYPTKAPTPYPTRYPTRSPSRRPSFQPSLSKVPTPSPTSYPTRSPNSLYGSVACVAVMDESIERTLEEVAEHWGKFRDRYPDRYFCLLQPFYFIDGKDEDQFLESYPGGIYEEMLRVPDSYHNDRRTSFHQVNRDSGKTEYRDDWYDLCDVEEWKLRGLDRLALFVDQSGSMDIGTVRQSYDWFITKVQASNIEIVSGNSNDDEDWVKPFYTSFNNPVYQDDSIDDDWCKNNPVDTLIGKLLQAPLRAWNALT